MHVPPTHNDVLQDPVYDMHSRAAEFIGYTISIAVHYWYGHTDTCTDVTTLYILYIYIILDNTTIGSS